MGPNTLSRCAMVFGFAAIAVVSFCFGKYYLGGKRIKGNSAPVYHIPHDYGASSNRGQSASGSDTTRHGPAGRSSGVGTAAPEKPQITIELSNNSESSSANTTEQPQAEARDREAKPEPSTRETEPRAKVSEHATSGDDTETPAARQDRKPLPPRRAEQEPQKQAPPTRTEPRPARPSKSLPQPVVPEKPARVESVAPAAEKTYRVLVGSFASKDNSRTLSSQLSKKGYYTFTSAKEVGGRKLYRVQVGAFSDVGKAEQLKHELESQGYNASIAGD